MTESGGLPEVQFESTVWLFRGSLLTVTEVTILLISCCPQHWPSPMSWSALTLLEVRCDLLKQSLFDFLQSQSRIGRNQAERTNEIRRFEMPWPSLMCWSALTLLVVRCDLLKQSFNILLFSCYPQHWPSPMSWSALTLLEVRCDHLKTITFWLSSKSIENRTESGGTYQRNQAFRLTTACGFFEMPWPSQMSIRTHHVILSVDVIWCLIGTDFLSEERSASLTCNWSIRTSFLRLLVGLFRQLNMSKKKNMFCHICILFMKCCSDTREDACNYTTDWYNFYIDMGFYSFCQKICHPFRQMIIPFRLWLPSNLVQARTSALFV